MTTAESTESGRTSIDAPIRTSHAPRVVTAVVWGVWIATVVVAVVLTVNYARRFPFSNDWEVVPVLGGQRPFSLGWLWSQSTDHRLVVPRIAILGLVEASSGDFRSVPWFDLVIVGALSAAAIATMRRVRGRTVLADALFPLVLLAPFQYGLTWSFGVHFTTVAVASVAALLIMVRYGLDAPLAWQWAALLAALVLYGDGAPGLAMVPGILAWSGLSAWRLRASSRPASTALLAAVGGFVVLGALYFVGWGGAQLATPGPLDMAKTALRLATVPGGPEATRLWPVAGVVVGIALVATVLVLVVPARSTEVDRSARDRAVALLCFGGSVGALVLAFGWGRGTLTWDSRWAGQYAGLGMPVLCWIYVSWATARERLRVVAAVLAAASLVAYVGNLGPTRDLLERQVREQRAFESDLCRIDPDDLARRHRDFLLLNPTQDEVADVASQLRVLRRTDELGFGCR